MTLIKLINTDLQISVIRFKFVKFVFYFYQFLSLASVSSVFPIISFFFLISFYL